MSAPTNTKKLATSAAPKVVVRRSSKRTIVTMAMKRQLRNNAKSSTRSTFPELPEWRRT
ncbi:hypothetical protein [Ralstonia pseudosolanacearum]|uniref:hypothetical protein n=1 Tax=Ralstonia pseudosolanacearum TaxID=1310165 RepID=UPI001FF986FF|nr:hypothetical protein [Ralstonia pseudosolanacearum]